jgi:alkylhydroperoxidase/carboxymuconolactone decarboxylase family protein YurZ
MVSQVEWTKYLNKLNLAGEYSRVRMLALFSSVITNGKHDLIRTTLRFLKENSVDKIAIYETVLQSYLFLGFPRMIEAALLFNEVFGDMGNSHKIEKISADESRMWFENGLSLCRQVYGCNYETLKNRFIKVSPEIFRWMVLEGYGKVLSRSGMTHIERELAEVAALAVDKRERQLLSHIMGSLNMGAVMELIILIMDDIRPLAGEENYSMALRLIAKVKKKHETKK